MEKPKIVLLVFVSGKIVLTGAKLRTEIYEAFERIYPVLQCESFFDFEMSLNLYSQHSVKCNNVGVGLGV